MKKKKFIQLESVKKFFGNQINAITLEFYSIIETLENEGRLAMPYGEKINKTNLFAIRIINTGNVRVFYVYGTENMVYGLNAYIKKTRKIPQKELKQAAKVAKLLKKEGLI